MARTYTYEGSYDNIPADSSPGLLFLKRALPAMDAMQPPFDLTSHFIGPDGTFTINGGLPVTVEQVSESLEMRSKGLAKFHHVLHKAWDIESDSVIDGKAKRTVMFESTSVTVFRQDPEQTAIKVNEFSIIELEEIDTGEPKAVSVVTYMDSRAVENHMAKLQGK